MAAKQLTMFQTEDLPLFSQTAVRGQVSPFPRDRTTFLCRPTTF